MESLLNIPTTDISSLIQCNLRTLSVAVDMIERLPADKYNHVEKPYFDSCLGKHIRHIVDHYLCFIRDIDSGLINYEKRQRNNEIETDKQVALNIISHVQQTFMEYIDGRMLDKHVSIILCNDVQLPEGEVTQSSVRRELQFLQGHTVHHYAFIATMLRFYGIDTAHEFGVAPSTLLYEKDSHNKTMSEANKNKITQQQTANIPA